MIEGPMSRVNLKPILILALIAASFSTIASGAPPSKPRAARAARSLRAPRVGLFTVSRDAASAQSPDLRVEIDPESGLLLPPSRARAVTPESERASSIGSTMPLVVITLPDGTKMVNLRGRFTSYLVALRDSTGRAHARCVQGTTSVRRFFEGGRVVDALGARR